MKREILIKLTIDWEDYDDVDPEIILDDAIESVKDGVSLEVIKEIK